MTTSMTDQDRPDGRNHRLRRPKSQIPSNSANVLTIAPRLSSYCLPDLLEGRGTDATSVEERAKKSEGGVCEKY